jgi:hypothetical protein
MAQNLIVEIREGICMAAFHLFQPAADGIGGEVHSLTLNPERSQYHEGQAFADAKSFLLAHSVQKPIEGEKNQRGEDVYHISHLHQWVEARLLPQEGWSDE